MGSREDMSYNVSDIKLQNIEKINNFIFSMAQNENFSITLFISIVI